MCQSLDNNNAKVLLNTFAKDSVKKKYIYKILQKLRVRACVRVCALYFIFIISSKNDNTAGNRAGEANNERLAHLPHPVLSSPKPPAILRDRAKTRP